MQVVSNPFILMTSSERSGACQSTSMRCQQDLVQHAPTCSPREVDQLASAIPIDSAAALPMKIYDVPSCPSNDLTSHSVIQQDLQCINAASRPDSRPQQAQRSLYHRPQLMSTPRSWASEPHSAASLPSTSNPATSSAVFVQRNPSSVGEQSISQLAESEQTVKKETLARVSLARSCSAPQAKLIGPRSTSDRFVQPLQASVEMLRPPRQLSIGARALQHSTSQLSSAFRTSSLPPIDDSSSFPQRLVDVEVYSLGMFAFKGLTAHRQIAQLMPSSLSERLALFPHVLKRGKATCVTYDNRLLAVTAALLPDVSGLTLSQ